MIQPDRLILSVFCCAELDHLPEEQLQKHALLLVDRFEEVLDFLAQNYPENPWLSNFLTDRVLKEDLANCKN